MNPFYSISGEIVSLQAKRTNEYLGILYMTLGIITEMR